jgi:type II secretory pathway pseudopilin PulG
MRMEARMRADTDRHRMRSALRGERGFALPLSLAVLGVVAGLATVAAKGAVVATGNSQRDGNAKRALQAASAGVKAATYQMNLLQPAALECVTPTTTGTLARTAIAPVKSRSFSQLSVDRGA